MLQPVPAPPVPFAVTSDELRALSRLTGAPLSGLFLDEDTAYDEADAPVADAVALRSLVARGLATVGEHLLSPDVVTASAAARSTLGALLAPAALVEVEADRAASPWVERHVIAAGRSGPTTVLTEVGADVWEVAEGPEDLAAAVRLVTRLDADDEARRPAGRAITVPVVIHELADAALDEAGPAAAVAVLVGGGADPAMATAGADAVERRTASLEVRAARVPQGISDGIDAGSVRLLVGGPLGTWVFDTEDGGDTEDGDFDQTRSVMTEIGLEAAVALVDALVRPSVAAAAS